MTQIREQGKENLCDLPHLSRQGRCATGQERAQEVQERCVGDGVVSRKATALHQQEVVRAGIGFDLSHQARFADARFPRQQGDVPLAAFRPIDEQVEQCEVQGTPD